jgi:divalent metal cation (Fe/Co/Zn/Cd) transporter
MLLFFASLLGLVVGYVVAAFAGGWAIDAFSSNMHDRSVEAAMTAAFVIGPAGAVVGAVAGFVLSRARKG